MAFPNISDIAATTIDKRSKKIGNNVLKNNGLLAALGAKGKVKTFSGGTQITQELSFAENPNKGWYSGYDVLPTAPADMISAAQFAIKQAACPVTFSGLEELQNASTEQMIDLVEARLGITEDTMKNLVGTAMYGDGTAAGGKAIDGLDAAVAITPTGTYGGINRTTWPFWANKSTTAGVALTTSTVQAAMNTMWASLCRGADRPDLIVMDNNFWGLYMGSLQSIQRFADVSTADLGFPSIKFMGTDVILDGAIGGGATTKTAYFLNTKYLFFRPHSARNFVSLSPDRRYAVNQDASVAILAWAGNMSCNGAQFQGRLITP